MPVAEPDVVWARSGHSAFSLGCPVVEGRDRHTGDVMDFFGREHLTTVGQGFRHEDSLRLEGDEAEPSALRRAVSHKL
jgi:hypothetical protein